jgi:hypothetical protein
VTWDQLHGGKVHQRTCQVIQNKDLKICRRHLIFLVLLMQIGLEGQSSLKNVKNSRLVASSEQYEAGL